MSAKKKSAAPKPTASEVAILRVLWARGEATVREVHDEVSAATGQGYTTILKLLQIMAGKGLVLRDESARTHVYRAALPPERTRRSLVMDLIDRVFDGSAAALVQQALGSGKVSRGEMEVIREMIDRLDPPPPAPSETNKSSADD